MQDNTPIYTTQIIKDQLEKHCVTVIKLPLYSPNLNSIKNLWVILKREIYKSFLELRIAPNTEETKKELVTAAQYIWEYLGDQIIENLADSMLDRVAAVIKVEGWYRKYQIGVQSSDNNKQFLGWKRLSFFSNFFHLTISHSDFLLSLTLVLEPHQLPDELARTQQEKGYALSLPALYTKSTSI